MAALTKAEKKLRLLHKHFEVCRQCNIGEVLCQVGRQLYEDYKESKDGSQSS